MRLAMLLLIGLVGALWCYADARQQAVQPMPAEFAKPMPIRAGMGMDHWAGDADGTMCDRRDCENRHDLIRSTLPLDPSLGAVYCTASYPTRAALAGGSPC